MSDMVNYGIDLGTTNSAIAKFDGSEVRIFKNRDQMDVTPSVVRIEKSGRIIVGRRAYQTLLSDDENVVSEFKRWMGQSDKKTFLGSGKSMDAEELSAEVLKSLIEDARRQTTDSIDIAVITVPAAFGQLQCEATARAGARAGLINPTLIQEPLAASIAYGMKPGTRDKRWLVYDLGGGTFDITVVSTKDGRLSVMEHKGDNMLGGKEFDRALVDKILWPKLQERYNLPNTDRATRYRKINQILRLKAEEAKIDLSLSERTVVSIFEVGEDAEGNSIEAEITISRTELNQLIEPYIAKTISLCEEALKGGRVSKEEISAIILVGGPTQMPLVRDMLTAELGASLDYSIDPMTVVARGAAIYASTIPKPKTSPITENPNTANLTLAHESIWSENTCLVAGRLLSDATSHNKVEILIEGDSGHWSSGWIPMRNDYFETSVHLLERQTNRFWIYLRDEKGKDIRPNPDSFTIRHGLTIAEPPLPHTIGVEVATQNNKSEIDIIFARSTPLPASKRIVYKARKTLKPGDNDDFLAVKIWEGEWFSDPEANTYVGVLKINANTIHRTIPEGAEIEISIGINSSRLMQVQAFIPVLNQHFQEQVYVAKDNEEVAMDSVREIKKSLANQFDRINKLDQVAKDNNDDELEKDVADMKTKLIQISEEHSRLEKESHNNPDDAKKIVKESKEIRGHLSNIEKQIDQQGKLPRILRQIDSEKDQAKEVVEKWGQKLDKKEYELLCKEADRLVENEDTKGLDKITTDLSGLKWRVLFRQEWYWKECFDYLASPGIPFVNDEEASKLIASGHEHASRGDGQALRQVVRKLWDIQPKDTAETEREMVLQSGIKRKLI